MNNPEQVLELLFEENLQPMWIYRVEDLRILNVNNAAIEVYGYTQDEFKNLTLEDLRPDKERKYITRLISEIDLDKKNSIDAKHIDKYGTVFWVHIIAIPVSYKDTRCRLVTVRNIQEVLDFKAEIGRKARELQMVLDNSVDVICSFDIKGRFIRCSRASVNVWGYSPDELIGEPYIDFIIEEDREFTLKVASQIMSGMDFTNFQNRYKRKDGSTVYIVWSARWDIQEQTMFCVARDATEKQSAEKLLKEHSDRIVTILESITDAFFAVDHNWIVTYWNSEAERILGRSRNQMIGRNIWDEYSDAIPLKFFSEYHRAVDEQISVHFEERLPQLNIWLEVAAYPSQDGLSVYFKDITSKRSALQELALSEARHRGIINSQTNYLIRTDLEGKYSYINGSFHRDFGFLYPDGNLIGKDAISSIFPYHHQTVAETVSKCLNAPNEVFHVEIDKPRRDGSTRTTIWDFICLTDTYGIAKEIQCSGIDISDRVMAEKALKESITRYGYVMKATSDAIWDWNITSGTIYWGDSITTTFGHCVKYNSTTIGFWSEQIHPDDLERVDDSINSFIMGEDTRWEEEYRFKNLHSGEYAHVRDQGFLIRDQSGSAIRMIGSMADITGRKQSELKLKEMNEQLSTFMSELQSTNRELEQFSYIVSHNLRAPVANLIGLANLLSENEISDTENSALIDSIMKSSIRLDQIITDLNDILKIKGRLQDNKVVVNLQSVIANVKLDLDDMIQATAAIIHVDFTSSCEIFGIRGYIHSIFLNLISNSIKYCQPDLPPIISIRSYRTTEALILTFSDNGLGIDLVNQGKHLFKLYKRFHYHTEGKGVGLYMVKAQVEALSGKIRVNSTVGKGSTFTIEFPLSV